jgi:tetratricopeptide (TPR) repeat protein
MEETVQELENRAISLLASRQLDAAHVAAQAAIEFVEANWGADSSRLVSLFRLMAKIHDPPIGTRNDLAVQYLFRAIDISRIHPLDDSVQCSLLGQAASALHTAGRVGEAREMQERALGLAERAGSPAEVAFQLHGLALIVSDVDQAEAVPLWQRLVEFQACDAKDSMSHMMALAQLGRCLLRVGRNADAIEALEHSLRILDVLNKGLSSRWSDDIRELIDKARSSEP